MMLNQELILTRCQEIDDSLELLFDAGIIPESLSENLQKMARFRNLLVHMYWKVDYGTVYDIIRYNMEDLRSFSSIVAALL